MKKISLDAIAREQQKKASTASSGRAAATVFGGHEKALRQTVIALTGGSELSEHANPGEATVLVLAGRVKLVSPDASWEARRGDLLAVPDARHTLLALEDASVLLTVVKL